MEHTRGVDVATAVEARGKLIVHAQAVEGRDGSDTLLDRGRAHPLGLVEAIDTLVGTEVPDHHRHLGALKQWILDDGGHAAGKTVGPKAVEIGAIGYDGTVRQRNRVGIGHFGDGCCHQPGVLGQETSHAGTVNIDEMDLRLHGQSQQGGQKEEKFSTNTCHCFL